MTIKVGINGFGRMGRLLMRIAAHLPEFTFVRINDPAADAATMAHLLNFDSIHGRWQTEAKAHDALLLVGRHRISYSQNSAIADSDWSECDVVIEASGCFRSSNVLQAYLDQGVERVIVTAPIKDGRALNIVMGVNDHLFDPRQHPIVTAASCTTNCLAPIIKVIHENLTIRHGSMTTIHDITNTQSILDQPHKDLRRARACGLSLIPTTTGSATAISEIFPELKGKLNGHAIRVPVANASLTDCVFEVERPSTVTEVNALLKQASLGELDGILGYEERPLVSVDYKSDTRSAVVDALSTLVIGDTQVKLFVWYDNEYGYIHRTCDLLRLVAGL